MKLNDLKETLITITEPRRVSYGNIRHKLDDIIIIGLCTVICGGEDYNDMEAFGLEREEWLRTFLELPNGIPDSDTFRRLFERLNPAELSECLNSWLEIEREKRSVVAIDGIMMLNCISGIFRLNFRPLKRLKRTTGGLKDVHITC